MTAPAGIEAICRAYLAPSSTAHPPDEGASEWTPLIDGAEYLPALADAIAETERGDHLFVLGLQLDPDVDLRGHPVGSREHTPVGEVLAEAAARGVDVRVVLAGSVFTGGLPLRVGPFAGNVQAAASLRSWVPESIAGSQPPLAQRVVLDWSGHRLGTNHQKAVVLTRGGQLEAFVGGMDIAPGRFDAPPHDRMRRGEEPWGWHDAAQRLRGPVAARVWEVARDRWREAASLGARPAWYRNRGVRALNPHPLPPDPGPPPTPAPLGKFDHRIQILRSYGPYKQHPPPPLPRRAWTHIPPGGLREIFEALAHAIDAARTYVYVEDQYFREYPGGDRRYELYSRLSDAAARGVRVILVGSGVRRPDDVGAGPANRTLTADIRRKVVEPLPAASRTNVVFYRVEGLTVHSKVVLVDDRFACIGSANLFSRSMAGTDHELSVAVVDAGSAVRDLRVRLWSDHMRLDPAEPATRARLDPIEACLHAWRPEWGSDRPGDLLVRPPLVLVGP